MPPIFFTRSRPVIGRTGSDSREVGRRGVFEVDEQHKHLCLRRAVVKMALSGRPAYYEKCAICQVLLQSIISEPLKFDRSWVGGSISFKNERTGVGLGGGPEPARQLAVMEPAELIEPVEVALSPLHGLQLLRRLGHACRGGARPLHRPVPHPSGPACLSPD